MSRTKRVVLALIVATGLPLLGFFGEAMAGGAFFPLDPRSLGFELKDTGNVTAVIVLDPNGPVSTGAPATPTGTFGSIVITRQNIGTAAATFRVEPDSSLGELQFGCNLLRTDSRFVDLAAGVNGLPFGGPGPFANWLSSDVTSKLFTQLGVTLVDPSTLTILRVPAITRVISQQCAPFPKPPRTLDNLLFSEFIKNFNIKPLPPTYPDLSLNSVGTDPLTQWAPGFLVLQVGIGFWALPITSVP